MNRIKFWRQERGLSQYDVAQLSGIPRAAIQLIEAGHRLPTLEQMSQIAEVLDISVKQLQPKNKTAVTGVRDV